MSEPRATPDEQAGLFCMLALLVAAQLERVPLRARMTTGTDRPRRPRATAGSRLPRQPMVLANVRPSPRAVEQWAELGGQLR
jgi:hypothetical protein